MRSSTKSTLTFFQFFIPILLLLGGTALAARLHLMGLPSMGQVPAFAFQDGNENIFESRELKGKVWVASFFSTSCHMSCPVQNAYLSQLQAKWGKTTDLQLVSFTMNPQMDTPQVLAEYSKDFHAIEGQWHFLTGSKTKLYQLAQNGFGLGNGKAGDLPDFIHTTRLALVDRDGVVRGYYDSAKPEELKKMEKDIQQLL